MITKFKIFEVVKKPEIDELTIRVEGERGWYIDFYFEYGETGDLLIYVDNKWDISIPDWYYQRFSNPIVVIRTWAKRYDKKCEVYHILQKEVDKYNL